MLMCLFALNVSSTRVQSFQQVSKLGPLVYFKPRPRVTTAEPSTEVNSESYDKQIYYTQSSVSTEASATSTEQPVTKPSYGSSEADIQAHLNALVKLLLQTKSHSPKFLVMMPIMANGKPVETTNAAATQPPATVKPKPKKKIKYIMV